MAGERPYPNRAEAGRQLAGLLTHLAGRDDMIVLALPRGGVPVAVPVASRLDVPLDVLLVRKLGTPGQQELAMGAIVSGGVRVINETVVRALDIPREAIDEETEIQRRELERRERLYRQGHAPPELAGRTAILVDDGLATGSTMLAAVRAARQLGALRIVVAVPVAPPDTLERLGREADEVVCPLAPARLQSVGEWYEEFPQVSDEEVRSLLARARHRSDAPRQRRNRAPSAL